MGYGKAYNHVGSNHAAEKLDGSLDLGGVGAAFRRLAHVTSVDEMPKHLPLMAVHAAQLSS
jgi:hypothetical protein